MIAVRRAAITVVSIAIAAALVISCSTRVVDLDRLLLPDAAHVLPDGALDAASGSDDGGFDAGVAPDVGLVIPDAAAPDAL